MLDQQSDTSWWIPPILHYALIGSRYSRFVLLRGSALVLQAKAKFGRFLRRRRDWVDLSKDENKVPFETYSRYLPAKFLKSWTEHDGRVARPASWRAEISSFRLSQAAIVEEFLDYTTAILSIIGCWKARCCQSIRPPHDLFQQRMSVRYRWNPAFDGHICTIEFWCLE